MMKKPITYAAAVLAACLLGCAKQAEPAEPSSLPLPSAKPSAEPTPSPTPAPEAMKEPEVPFTYWGDYENWAVEVGYPSGELIAGGREGIGSDRFYTLPESPGYESGRIVIGDSRCVQLGIYQQRAKGSEYAVFAAWGGHYVNWEPYLPDEEFFRRVEECFQAQVEACGHCDLYFFATVNDYDFRENRNEASAEAAAAAAERLASMRTEHQGQTVSPRVTFIGIVAGSRDVPVVGYPCEEFNRYEDAFNELLKETVSASPILHEAEWTTVPKILEGTIGFISDGLHYDDPTLRKLAAYMNH